MMTSLKQIITLLLVLFIIGCESSHYSYPGSSGTITDYENFIRNNPNDNDVKEDIGSLAMEFGLYQVAVKSFRSILKDFSDRPYIHKQLGVALQKTGMNNEAVLHLEKAAVDHGEDLELLLTLAQAYLGMDMLIRADKWAGIAHRLYPENREAKRILSQCS